MKNDHIFSFTDTAMETFDVKASNIAKTNIKYIVVDLFCGAGGVTTGFENSGVAKVIACVNHDPVAIATHKANHPGSVHFIEDIRTLDIGENSELVCLVKLARIKYPNAKLILWGSLECTNYSKAKGGMPKNPDSRTLAWDFKRYIPALDPDYIMIENVVEFMSWGPLDEHNRPISRKNGIHWIQWRQSILELGYRDEWREMNSENYGAHTSRNRLFGCFAKIGIPIAWPDATHCRKDNGMKPVKPVRDVLDMDHIGENIFLRKKPYCEKTLQRIYSGLIKYVAGGKNQFMIKYNSMGQNGRYNPTSVDEPLGVIPTANMHYKVCASYIVNNYSGQPDSKVSSIEKPCPTITTIPHQSLVQTSSFILKYYNSDHNHSSLDMPAGTLTTNNKMALVTGQKGFLVNPQYSSDGRSIDNTCFTLIASMNKMPPYLVQYNSGEVYIEVYPTDSEYTVKIKEFMAMYGLSEVFMRALTVDELKRIQGFPDDYILKGTKSDQLRQIGNSVVPIKVSKWISALSQYQS